MEDASQPKRPARRKHPRTTGRKPTTGLRKTVGLEEDAFQQLERAARRARVSKTVFTSAAVRYFTEKGIDPTQLGEAPGMADVMEKLTHLSTKVEGMQETARRQSADIGNRLVAIWRALEVDLYGHLATEQSAMLLYLEAIESNLLAKLSATESNYLSPLMEQELKTQSEALLSRKLSSLLFEFRNKTTVTPGERANIHKYYDELSEKQVVDSSQEVLAKISALQQVKSRRPNITAPPASALPPRKLKPPATLTLPPLQP